MAYRIGIWAANIGSNDHPRGLQRVAREISKNFRNKDVAEFVAVEAIDLVSGRPVVKFSDLQDFLGGQKRTVRFCDVKDLNVVLSFECYESIWSLPLTRIGLKVACVIHDLIPMRIEEFSGVDRSRFYNAISNAVDKASLLINVSLSTKLDLLELFPEAGDRSVVIYNGYGNSVLENSSSISRPQRPDNYKTVTMVGTVERRKNHAAVMEALRLLAIEHPNRKYRFLAVGDNRDDLIGRNFPDLLKSAQQHLFIEFPGFVDDFELSLIYSESDAVVFASLWEGFGIPMLEAMAYGVPIVSSDLSSMPEVAREHAYYCDPYNIESIKKAIEQATSLSPAQRLHRIEKAKRWTSNFNWKTLASDYEACLLGLATESNDISAPYTEKLIESYMG